MRQSSRRRAGWMGWLVAPLLTTGCGYLFVEFDYSREEVGEPGEVAGQAVRAEFVDLPPAPYARIAAEGAGILRRADRQGGFRFTGLVPGPWLFRGQDDVDGDGWPERTLQVAAYVRSDVKPRGVLGDGPPEVASVLLGKVSMEGTTRIKGQLLVQTSSGDVPATDLGLIGRVYAFRDGALPDGVNTFFVDGTTAESTLASLDVVSLGAEASTTADANGFFVFPAVGAGRFLVVAFLFDRAAEQGALGPLRAAAAPLSIQGGTGGTQDISATPLMATTPSVAIVDERRTLQVRVLPEPVAETYLVAVPAGREAPPCETAPPVDYAGTPFPYALRGELRAWGGELRADFPLGVYDVTVCTAAGVDGPRGITRGVVLPKAVDETTSLLPIVVGPVLLQSAGECETEAGRDCDGDGLLGLPPFSDASRDLWAACAQACRDAFGEENQERTCTFDEQVFDCEDDGDGQPDVTEPPSCYGPGRGTDLDGDGLCSTLDPFPQCQANDAAQCEAGAFDVMPQVPPTYVPPAAPPSVDAGVGSEPDSGATDDGDGGEPDGGAADAGVGGEPDSGATDAGDLPDGGTPDGGATSDAGGDGGDAGTPTDAGLLDGGAGGQDAG